jgi:flagellar hook-basal body complex protein FliE
MAVDKLAGAGLDVPRSGAASQKPLVESLGETFGRLMDDVNRYQLEADRKIEEFATSPTKDIHGTMIAMQQADVALRLMLQIRAKLTSAYQEIMRTQI